ncbi:TetR/AcrR family transcriptional regulator [Streptomyces sp. BBFR51]|uniref:TetR/AcrR family transcriptional regulator n=1 Tax=Streptomyces sp. BBFR51 TaxID=3372856 RepID=UPI0037DC5DB5
MGHRDDLIDGAMQCLREKGYARTTTRDIVAASKTNLASIGYHYGTKESLLRAALIKSMDEWGTETFAAVAEETSDVAADDPLARFEAVWTKIINAVPDNRALWVLSFEVFAQLDHDEELRTFMAQAMPDAYEAFAELFGGLTATADPQSARLVGMLCHSLLTGVLSQWLIDPENAPSGHDLTEALRLITGIRATATA